MPAHIALAGLRFGRLVVVERDRSRPTGHRALWTCRCDCGEKTSVAGQELRRGDTKSCGCLRRATTTAKNATHGMSGSQTYQCWVHMIQRCTNPKNKNFHDYGRRGITVCQRWLTFENFLADMGARPVGKTLDRRDNDGNYEPGNCRWATQHQQVNNRRGNVLVEHNGKTMTVAELAVATGVKYDTLHQRITSGKKNRVPHIRRT